MTRSPSSRNRIPPRRRTGQVPALATGFFVIVIALGLAFFEPLTNFTSERLVDDNTEVVADAWEIELSEPDKPASEPARLVQTTYIEGDVGFPDTFNPLLAATMSEHAVSAMLYRQLLGTSSTGDPEPDLAVEWRVSEDGLTHTIELDPDARWHDGEPVTMADVLFTIDLVKDPEFPGDPGLSRFWRAIDVHQAGDRTIEFRLMEPYVGFAGYLKLPILPRHRLGGMMAGDLLEFEFDAAHTGSTDFRIEAVERDAGEIRFVRVDGASDHGFNKVIFRYFESQAEAISALRDGDLDGIAYLPPGELNNEVISETNAQIYGAEMAGYTALFFNLRHPYFRDVHTRQAVEHAIDRERLVTSALDGRATVGSSPIPAMFSAFEPTSGGQYDVELAAQKLDESGWTLDDGEEYRRRDGEYLMIPLIVNGDDPQRIAVAAVLQEQLRDVGIHVDIQALPSADVQRLLESRQYTAALFGWHSDNGNLDCFEMWHSSQMEDGSNITGFSDASADEVLIAARRAATIGERNEHYAEFQQIFAEQVPAVVLFYPRYHYAVSDRIMGVDPGQVTNTGDRVRRIPEWYVS